MNILISIIIVGMAWSGWCWWLYNRRTKEVIIVDFDTVIADTSLILKRAEMYVQNKPDKTIEDYISAHINEQKPIEGGIKRVWDFQQKSYKIVFITNLKEYLRLPVADFLNRWGLRGELYMHDMGDIGAVEKIWLVQKYRAKKYKVSGLLDYSSDAIEVYKKTSVKII